MSAAVYVASAFTAVCLWNWLGPNGVSFTSRFRRPNVGLTSVRTVASHPHHWSIGPRSVLSWIISVHSSCKGDVPGRIQQGWRHVLRFHRLNSLVTPLQYKGGIFKIPMPDQWLVVVTGPQLIDELRKFPDDTMSLPRGLEEVC